MYEQLKNEKALQSKAVANSVGQMKRIDQKSLVFTDNRVGNAVQRVIQFDWPRTLNIDFARQLVHIVMDEKSIEYSNEIAQPYVEKIMYDDEAHTALTGWSSRDSILIYLRNTIVNDQEQAPEAVYEDIIGIYGTIRHDMVRILVEEWGCNIETLQTAVDRITNDFGRWNYVRRLDATSSELKLSGALQTADQRVFAGADRIFSRIGNALH